MTTRSVGASKPITFERDGGTWMVRVHSRTAGKSHAEDHAATPDDLRAVGWVPAHESAKLVADAIGRAEKAERERDENANYHSTTILELQKAEARAEKAEKTIAEAWSKLTGWDVHRFENSKQEALLAACDRSMQALSDEQAVRAKAENERDALRTRALGAEAELKRVHDAAVRGGAHRGNRIRETADCAINAISELRAVSEKAMRDCADWKNVAEERLRRLSATERVYKARVDALERVIAARDTLRTFADLNAAPALTPATGSPPCSQCDGTGIVGGELPCPGKCSACDEGATAPPAGNAGESVYITTRKSSLQVGVDEALRVTPPDGRCELVSVAVTGNEVLFFWRRAAEGASGG